MRDQPWALLWWCHAHEWTGLMLYLEMAQSTACIQLCQALGGMQQLLH